MSTLKVDNLLLQDNTKGTGRILEMIGGVCDGRSITTISGTYSLQNVTALQTTSTSYADQNGSIINYKPPEGTKTVIYETYFHIMPVDAHGITHHRLYIDDQEIQTARTTFGAEDKQGKYIFKFPIIVGAASDDITNGKLQTWTNLKEVKIQVRQYGSGNENDLHSSTHWDGSGTDQFAPPQLYITAIG